jgi:hypothetical protein
LTCSLAAFRRAMDHLLGAVWTRRSLQGGTSGLRSLDVQILSKPTTLQEGPTLTVKLLTQQIRRLVHGADHCVGSQFGLRFGDEI